MQNNPEVYPEYWDKEYGKERLGWDIGYVSPPLEDYFNQLQNKEIKILIPGAGNAYEAEFLYQKGFKNTFALDFSEKAVDSFLKRFPDFPRENMLVENYFEHQNTYDIIIEQAFFTSFPIEYRNDYAQKTHQLLKKGGKLVGLWFTHQFNNPFPPYGGTKEEYEALFGKYFQFKTFDIAYNSIKPRKGREFFIIMQK
jgi:thiopurine S-methyltransferase